MMAKFFHDASGNYGLRHGLSVDIPVPGGATIVEFDEETNAGLIDSLCGKTPGVLWQDHAIVGGVIQRQGSPVAINPPRVLTDIEALTEKTIALALVVLDAVNELRQWDTALKAAFQNNTTVANIRTAVLALPNTPDRTRAQLIQAVRDKLAEV